MQHFDRFAPYYDADYRNYDEDIDAIVEFALNTGQASLELGCGTGRLLVSVARAGCRVTGIDISPALLNIARTKVLRHGLSEHVSLVEADMRTVDLDPARFGFAYCVSNTLMHLTTQRDQMAALGRAWRHLMPGARLLLDLFNPDVPRLVEIAGVQELADQWTDPASGHHVIKWAVRSVDWAHQIQETLFIYEEIDGDGRARRTMCPFTLRFLWRDEAALMLAQCGFILEEVWGSYDADPYSADSEHLILIARKPV